MSTILRADQFDGFELPDFNLEVEDYLNKLLLSQDLRNDSAEVLALQREKTNIERIIREEFPMSQPRVEFGGSIAKGTANKETYDLDLPCYFSNQGQNPGETLEQIFHEVGRALNKHYNLKPKTSALRLLSKDPTTAHLDLHIDVIPGRFIDESNTDCYLYVKGPNRDRLQTNLQKHISFIRQSGQVPVIRLGKIWNHRRDVDLKTFSLELLIIEVLTPFRALTSSLQAALFIFFSELAAATSLIALKDPANPSGNDLNEIWNEETQAAISSRAKDALNKIKFSRWDSVFGEAEASSTAHKIQVVNSVASGLTTRNKHWAS